MGFKARVTMWAGSFPDPDQVHDAPGTTPWTTPVSHPRVGPRYTNTWGCAPPCSLHAHNVRKVVGEDVRWTCFFNHQNFTQKVTLSFHSKSHHPIQDLMTHLDTFVNDAKNVSKSP